MGSDERARRVTVEVVPTIGLSAGEVSGDLADVPERENPPVVCDDSPRDRVSVVLRTGIVEVRLELHATVAMELDVRISIGGNTATERDRVLVEREKLGQRRWVDGGFGMPGEIEDEALRDVAAAGRAPALGRSAVIEQPEALLAEAPLGLRIRRRGGCVIESEIEALRDVRPSARAPSPG